MKEPVVVSMVALDGLAAAVISLLSVFGLVDWTGEQKAAVIGVVTALSVLIGVFLRRNVVPVATHNELVAEALFTPVPVEDEGGAPGVG